MCECQRSHTVSEASVALFTFGVFAPRQLNHQIQVVPGQGILRHGLRHFLQPGYTRPALSLSSSLFFRLPGSLSSLLGTEVGEPDAPGNS